jgi:hypothetical protein
MSFGILPLFIANESAVHSVLIGLSNVGSTPVSGFGIDGVPGHKSSLIRCSSPVKRACRWSILTRSWSKRSAEYT